MSQNFPTNKSVPGSLNKKTSIVDETFEKEFDKIFHDDKDQLPINPSASGDVDEERKKYYRSASVDETAAQDAMSRKFSNISSSEPLQDQGLHGQDNKSWNLEGEHSNEDFQFNNPIMSKKKSSTNPGAKHRKSSEDRSTGKPIKKASTAAATLQGIPEGQLLSEEKEDDIEGSEDANKSSFPWKAERTDVPVLYTEENEEQEEEPKNKPSSGVKFSIGGGGDDEPEPEPEDDDAEHHRERGHRQNRHKSKVSKHDKSSSRRMSQDFVNLADESGELQEADLEEIAGHRFEKTRGGHKIKKPVIKIGKEDIEKIGHDMRSGLGYGYNEEVDHTPHALFIELDELEGEEWEERARWIKYEEDLEAERGEWGKPHVSSLTFHSLINLRLCFEQGSLILDIAVKDLTNLCHRVVEDLSQQNILAEEHKEKVLRVLLYRHKHVHPHENTFKFGLKRSMSQRSMQSLVDDSKKISHPSNGADGRSQTSPQNLNNLENGFGTKDNQMLVGSNGFNRSGSNSSSFRRIDSMDNMMKARKRDIITCMEDGTEGAVVLVGSLDEIDKPILAFVRLSEALFMPNTIEVSLPVRFIFILLTPSKNLNMDPHEIGRSFATLMSNPDFALVAYQVSKVEQILHAINIFLDDSVVLPPGDWDRKHILPIKEIMEMKQRRKERKGIKDDSEETEKEKDKEEKSDGPPKRNPLDRTSMPFGGLIDDIKERYPKYLSDIKDGLNAQCLATTIFIYFACLSGAIAFGGIMAEKTNNAIGISETLIISCVAGVIYALFSGCPLIIIGSTGPMLLFDEALFQFCEGDKDIKDDGNMPGMFLYWRTWVGIWTFVVSLVVAGFQGSTLVKYFTRFIKDIFASLISLVFIYEAFNKLAKIFAKHPLQGASLYCDHYETLPECYSRDNSTHIDVSEEDSSMITLLNHVTNVETTFNSTDEINYCDIIENRGPQPNTALLSAILMFGCFFIAYFLRLFRNSQFLGRNARRALGDFGVPIAIVIAVLVDFGAGDTYTEKLNVPEGLEVTDSSQRGWFIPPVGTGLPVWAMFAGLLPAILLYLLLFIETSICELIMMEKTKDGKGAGLHLDIVIISFINLICGLFGGPWICAATVRAVAHVSALTVFATSHIPGEPNKAIGVRDQRVTFGVVSILLGVSVVLAPVLKQVPFAVLFGVFLYMGVSGMNGIQFFDRLKLCLMPIKHHPSVTYVKRVKTWRMIMFTLLQALGLGILWGVKSSAAALAFPFFVVAMIPFRWSLKFLFTPVELEALDGPSAGQSYEKDEEEMDFYETANAVPTARPSNFGLHKAMLDLVNMTNVMKVAKE